MPPTDDQISRYLADPLSFPPEFKSWVVKYLEQHQPSLLIRQLAGTLLPSKIAGYPGSAGKVLAGDGTWPNPPGYEYVYVEVTAGSPITSTVTVQANATTLLTASAVTLDGATKVVVEFYCAEAWHSVANGVVVFNLWDGSTDLGFLTRAITPLTNQGVYVRVARELTPSAGSHTYSVRIWEATAGTASVGYGNGSTGNDMPMFLKVTKA